MEKRDAAKNLEVICGGRPITDQGGTRGKREARGAGRTVIPGETDGAKSQDRAN